MGCRCKDFTWEINLSKSEIAKLRELFIKRMTVDSETHDARRKDFNQAIFGFNDDGSTYQCFYGTDMDMVLQCFDDAVKDWRRTWCDVENCTRK